MELSTPDESAKLKVRSVESTWSGSPVMVVISPFTACMSLFILTAPWITPKKIGRKMVKTTQRKIAKVLYRLASTLLSLSASTAFTSSLGSRVPSSSASSCSSFMRTALGKSLM